jgi:hypothetical protein
LCFSWPCTYSSVCSRAMFMNPSAVAPPSNRMRRVRRALICFVYVTLEGWGKGESTGESTGSSGGRQ